METRDKLIQVTDLEKHYNFGRIKAIDGISVDIFRGDVMVVIGPSGSGKSTFLRSLNLMEEPTGGAILFDNVDITKKKYRSDTILSFFYECAQKFHFSTCSPLSLWGIM